MLVAQRDPIVTAKAIASLDLLSGGRVLLGVGAGWNIEEMEDHGVDPARRFGRMRESVEAMRALWTQDEASYAGDHIAFPPTWSWPKPLQPGGPPVLLGGNGKRVLERVVKYGDAWYPNFLGDDDKMIARLEKLRVLGEEAGRGALPTTLQVAPTEPERLARLRGGGRHAHRLVPAVGRPRRDRARARSLRRGGRRLPLRRGLKGRGLMPGARVQPGAADPERRLDPYVPRVLLRHLARDPDARVMSLDATVVFADISGFTALSERLARRGREGAEELTETIGGSLSALLTVAYENGGSLLTLGGDALLLLFEHEGHAQPRVPGRGRACAHAARASGRLQTSAGRVTLRVSQGVHSGTLPPLPRRRLAPRAHARRARGIDRRADGEGRRRRRDPDQPADRGAAPGALRRSAEGPGAAARGGAARRRRPGTSRRSRARRSMPSRSACRRWCAPTCLLGRAAVGAPQRDGRLPAFRGHRRR